MVQDVFDALKAKGHEVTTDWTLTYYIPEDVTTVTIGNLQPHLL